MDDDQRDQAHNPQQAESQRDVTQHLSAQRSNGLRAMVARIDEIARRTAEGEAA